jgi:hypothetical protein
MRYSPSTRLAKVRRSSALHLRDFLSIVPNWWKETVAERHRCLEATKLLGASIVVGVVVRASTFAPFCRTACSDTLRQIGGPMLTRGS